MELEKMGEKSGLGAAHLLNLGKHASFLIKDGLRIARLAFVDVSAPEMLTEDATNADDWGPTTKTMAAISDASKVYDDYLRIVQVLRGRLALTGKKQWRQVLKALTVMEYLLTHGPEQFVMEFREDKKRIEELTRFVYIDENLVDRGSSLQNKAKQVNQLLVNERFFKEERRRAQTVSKGILGFGSQSLRVYSGSTMGNQPNFRKCSTHPGTYVLRVGSPAHASDPKTDCASEVDISSPPSERTTRWSSSSMSSAIDSPETSSTSTDWSSFDESPTSAECFTSSSPITGDWTPPQRATNSTRRLSVDMETRSTASSRAMLPPMPRTPPLFKLPPPPRCTVPPPPPGGSKVGNLVSRNSLPHKPAQSVPDLIIM